MKYIIFIIIIFLSCCNSYAKFTNFEFELDKYFIEDNKEINVEFKYSLDGYTDKDFQIRPVILNGIIEILNQESGKWISSYGFTTDLPNLKKNILIRVRGVSVEKTEIFFEIRNINTSELYLTPKKYVWSNKVYEDYLEKIKIYKKEKENEEIIESGVLESSFSKNIDRIDDKDMKIENLGEKINEIPKIFFLILGIVSFITSFIVGYTKHIDFLWFIHKKKRIWMNGKIH